jgi:hypothetical protein
MEADLHARVLAKLKRDEILLAMVSDIPPGEISREETDEVLLGITSRKVHGLLGGELAFLPPNDFAEAIFQLLEARPNCFACGREIWREHDRWECISCEKIHCTNPSCVKKHSAIHKD